MNLKDLPWFIYVIISIWSIIIYVLGVHAGRKFEKRIVTLEFQQVIHKLLRFAGQQDYKSMHLMLHDLVEDNPPPIDPLTEEVKPKMTDSIQTRSDDDDTFA